MPRILFEGGDLDGEYQDLLIEPDDAKLKFDNSGGSKYFPRGIYEKTERQAVIDQVNATIWVCTDLMR